MKAGIINVTGYSGVELARLLSLHPEVDLVSVTGRSAVKQSLGDVFPHLGHIDLTIQPEIDKTVDIVFSALPQVASAEALTPLIRDGINAVDISADFRLKDPDEYATWYKSTHPAPDLLEQAVYGLTELNREDISSAKLIANPGCYPSSALLALAPLVQNDLINPTVVVDSKSGISGAGRGASMATHYSEVNENVQAYGLDGHRHLPEIVQELRNMSPGLVPEVTFIPHLIPMTRGILSTCYVWPSDGEFNFGKNSQDTVIELYKDFYKNDAFVKVVTSPPQTKQTWGSNDCLVFPVMYQQTGRLVVISCIDNLVKGAAGQAIQNMNLMFGFPETAGLESPAVYP